MSGKVSVPLKILRLVEKCIKKRPALKRTSRFFVIQILPESGMILELNAHSETDIADTLISRRKTVVDVLGRSRAIHRIHQ